MKLWYFNPENDLALAAGRAAYTPPMAAVRLRRSGAMLPAWMAELGDAVLCGGVSAAWLDAMHRDFGLDVVPWDGAPDVTPEPWGWSAYTRGVLERAGVPRGALPSDASLEALREISHRRSAARLREAVAARLDFDIWPGATEICSPADAEAYAAAALGGCVFKLPWSSSGRGVSFVEPGASLPPHIAGDISRYGSVMAEPLAARVADFAMLYDVSGGRADYRGLSVFETDARGAYQGNAVAPQQALERRLARLYPAGRLAEVSRAVGEALGELCAGRYEGPAGVDMLIARTARGVALHAAVEINFRYTMGFVALALGRYTAGEAIYRVERGDTTAGCRYRAEGGRLAEGRLALTPPGGDFTFVLESR